MDLISNVTSALGIAPPAAEGAVGSLFKLLKQQAPADAFAEVEQKVPESAKWMAAAPAADAPDGGGLGDIAGSLGGLAGGLSGGLGGALGSALGGLGGGAAGLPALITSLSKSGLGADAVGKLVPIVLTFLKGRVGDGVLGKLLAAAPFLANLTGGQGGAGSVLGNLGGLFK